MLEFFANLPGCLIGMEACGGAHYWARELTKLGHEVRLMPPQYVKPYVKTNKHDATVPRVVVRPSSARHAVRGQERDAAVVAMCIGSGIGWSQNEPARSVQFAGTWPSSGSLQHAVNSA